MAVYRGPREKIERRFGEAIFGKGKSLKKRSYGPGQHGKRRKSRSVYAQQLMEKQKLKYIYGLLEKQFFNLFKNSEKCKGLTGEILIQKLESRLDNVVYRLGISPTRRAARQLVSHRHITVNGSLITLPSYHTSVNDLISIKDRSKPMAVNAPSKSIYDWLDWDKKNLTGRILAIPSRDKIPENINEQKVVDLYSK